MASTKPSETAQWTAGLCSVSSGLLFCSTSFKEDEISVLQVGSLIAGIGCILYGAKTLAKPLKSGAIELWQTGKQRLSEATDGIRKWFVSSDKSARIGRGVLGCTLGAVTGYAAGIAVLPSVLFGGLVLSNMDLSQEESNPTMQILLGAWNRPFIMKLTDGRTEQFPSLANAIDTILKNPNLSEEKKEGHLEAVFYEALRTELTQRPQEFGRCLSVEAFKNPDLLEKLFLKALTRLIEDCRKKGMLADRFLLPESARRRTSYR